MKLPFSIARRYLFARKSQNVINIISMISVTGVMTGTIALLLVLSVFNGLHGLIGTLYGSFDPDIRIEPEKGKVFSLDSIPYQEIVDMEGIAHISMVLQDQALLKYNKRTAPAIIIGVDSEFQNVTGIDSIMIEGEFQLDKPNVKLGYLGIILADQLSVGINFVSPLVINVPRKSASFNILNAQRAFKSEAVMPGGIFSVRQVEYDSQYMLIGIDNARKLLEYSNDIVSQLYIKVKSDADVESVKKDLISLLDNKNLFVKNKEEQHAVFFKMMKMEKFIAYLILSFILLIAAFNIVGTLSMLIYEKKESIYTLKSMGANQKLVTRVFLFEGWLISLSGIILGLIVGIILIVIQQQFGIIKFNGGSDFVVDAYPVTLTFIDTLAVFVTVCVVSFLAAWYPVRSIVRKNYHAVND